MPARLLVLALLALLTAGCASVPTDRPSAVSVDVIQGRTDRDSRTIVLDVTNTSTDPIELVAAHLDTEQFSAPAVWDRGTTLKPGLTVSLRAPLADPTCPVPASAEPRVSVTYRDADGDTHTVKVEPTQSTDVLAIIARDDCIGVLAAQRAEIRVADTVAWTPGAKQPAVLTLDATPTGVGSLDIVEARSTILLQLVDATDARVGALPVDQKLDAQSGATQVTLSLVPSRCDPHAIAEDKRGTIMILEVRLDDGTDGVVYVRSGDGVKATLFEFVTDYCAT